MSSRSQPFLQGLLKAFDCALGLRVMGRAILLDDPEAEEFCFQARAAATVFAAGQVHGVNHSAIARR